jgi:NAD(P)H-dependent FMN reductase
MNIEIIAGSPRLGSTTFREALFLKNELERISAHTVNILDVRDWDLPHLQEVIKSPNHAPDDLRPLATRMFAADAFLLVSPEYNGSYTPAMKNLLDYFPKQSHKVFGVVTASPGIMGGMRASQQMQLLVAALFGILSPYMLITPGVDKKFDAEGNLLDESFQKQVDLFLREFLWLAESVKPEVVYN